MVEKKEKSAQSYFNLPYSSLLTSVLARNLSNEYDYVMLILQLCLMIR